jgi:hypothetical protein
MMLLKVCCVLTVGSHMTIQENTNKCTILLVCNIVHLLASSWILTISAWIRIQCHSTTGWIILKLRNILDVHGSVHHSINHLETTNKMRPCIKIYYSNVSDCSACFQRHIAHYQELKNYICSLCFYIRLWLPNSVRQPQTYIKPEAANTVFWAPDDEWCVARNMLSN